jgi:hypothetical protein
MAGEIDQQELIKKFLSDLAERGAPSEDDPLPFVGAANKVWYKEIEGQILGVCKTYLTKWLAEQLHVYIIVYYLC